jgi:hypothetical protein
VTAVSTPKAADIFTWEKKQTVFSVLEDIMTHRWPQGELVAPPWSLQGSSEAMILFSTVMHRDVFAWY